MDVRGLGNGGGVLCDADYRCGSRFPTDQEGSRVMILAQVPPIDATYFSTWLTPVVQQFQGFLTESMPLLMSLLVILTIPALLMYFIRVFTSR